MIGNQRATERVAKRIHELGLSHPTRVAVDGRTASGKTTFADALAVAMHQRGRLVIRALIDGFHRPRVERHRRGRLSPDGYYEDARDLYAMRQLLLDPLGASGDLHYVTASFDLERDKPLVWSPERAPDDAVLIVDGTFLQRPELRDTWDFVIFLDVRPDEARRRGVERDAPALGGIAAASELYDRRYGPAFARYDAECQPMDYADIVMDSLS
ncbi:uridine kinase [Sphingomonas swuensis]|uniref:Uridine kinase n=1 Tax=Sphingomonas swuensis TaxID=977800 RepID=A0ABP7SLF0_9SPHN